MCFVVPIEGFYLPGRNAMHRSKESWVANAGLGSRWLLALMMMTTACSLWAATAASGMVVAHNTPRYVTSAKNLGAEDPAKVIEVSIWLQLHNRSQFDALAKSLYDPKSANYRHWLKSKDVAVRFGPTASEAKTVREFLKGHNLTVVKTGPDNFYVRARGTVADVEKAFHVQLNNYQVRGKTIRANADDPYVEGAAGALVRAVSGLDSGGFEQQYIVRSSGIGGKQTPMTGVAKPAAMSNDEFFSSQCFAGTEKETFSSDNNGSLPIATFSGNKMNLASQTSIGCAYTPPMIQTAYHLNELYHEGREEFDGSDQVIAIIDWCGTPTILSDVNAFSAQFGLPQLIPIIASTSNLSWRSPIPRPILAKTGTTSKSTSMWSGRMRLHHTPTSIWSFLRRTAFRMWTKPSSWSCMMGSASYSRAAMVSRNGIPRPRNWKRRA